MHFEQIYDDSYERVLMRSIEGKDFFEVFYENFLASSSRVRLKFTDTNMQKQRQMLKKSFYHLLIFYGSNQTDNYLERVAQYHNKQNLDIKPEYYDLWMDNLVKTLRSFDPQCDDNIELAWRLVFAPGITYMKFKYDHCE